MDRRRDGAARRRRTTLDVESRHRKKDPRAHTRTHAPARGRQVAGEGRRVTARAVLSAGGVATGV